MVLLFQIPTGKIHRANNFQGIQNEGCSEEGGLFFMKMFLHFADIYLEIHNWFNFCRFQNSQTRHVKNGKKKFGNSNGHKRKGLWKIFLLFFLSAFFIRDGTSLIIFETWYT